MPKLPQRKPTATGKGLPKPRQTIGATQRTAQGAGKRRVQVLNLKEPRRLSNADDCLGYIVRTKPRVMVGPTDYGLRQGKIVNASTGENKEGIRIVAYHVELDGCVLEYVAAIDVDWIDKPKQ